MAMIQGISNTIDGRIFERIPKEGFSLTTVRNCKGLKRVKKGYELAEFRFDAKNNKRLVDRLSLILFVTDLNFLHQLRAFNFIMLYFHRLLTQYFQ